MNTQNRNLFFRLFDLIRRLALIAVVFVVIYLIGDSLNVLRAAWDEVNLQVVEEEIPTRAAIENAWDEHRTELEETHIPATLEVTVLGLALAIGIGLSLAAIMDLIPPLRWILYPLLVLSQTIPIFAIAVILILLFGFGAGPKIVVVALFCFYPITVSTLGGFRSVDNQHIALLRSMGANPLQMWWKVRLPTAMPAFFSGLKIAATYSVIGAVMGEYVGAGDGLGKFMQRSFRVFANDQVFLAVIIIALLSLSLFALVFLVERVALRWRYIGGHRLGFSLRYYIQLVKAYLSIHQDQVRSSLITKGETHV